MPRDPMYLFISPPLILAILFNGWAWVLPPSGELNGIFTRLGLACFIGTIIVLIGLLELAKKYGSPELIPTRPKWACLMATPVLMVVFMLMPVDLNMIKGFVSVGNSGPIDGSRPWGEVIDSIHPQEEPESNGKKLDRDAWPE